MLSIVKGKILAQLSDSGKQALSIIINDLEGYVESKIEVSLKNLKAKTNSISDNTSNIVPSNTTYNIPITTTSTESANVDYISSEEDVVTTQER